MNRNAPAFILDYSSYIDSFYQFRLHTNIFIIFRRLGLFSYAVSHSAMDLITIGWMR